MKVRVGLVLAATVFGVVACGQSTPPPGPDVRGLALPDAERALHQAGVGYSEHAQDGLFGIVVKEDWVVCSEHRVGPHMVRLDAAKHGC